MQHILPPVTLSGLLRHGWRALLIAGLLAGTASASWAQRGRQGAYTLNSGTGIVNDYTALTANATAGSNTVTVASSTLNTGNRFSTGALAAQDLVMVIQMQGASIDASNTATYGEVTAYNNAGRYEIMEVSSVTATTITFTCALRNNYTAGAGAQVVRIPRFSTMTVGGSATVTGSAWNGTTGGVVAVEVNGATTINGTVSATGLGFRGGATENNSEDGGNVVTGYRGTADTFGGEKGESIAGSQATYDGLNGRYGRGAAANGGGGGNSHNAAGGGGANVGTGPWTGFGNPDRGPSNAYDPAWNLESANFATSTSSGGGRGGYSYASVDANALTTGPGNSSWGGNGRQNVGGFGGRILNTSSRLFLGGGGGAGDGNNNGAVSGGNGGGLLYLLTGGAVSGSGTLAANGTTGFRIGSTTVQTSGAQDGGGGGGGGGTIVLNVTGAITGITASAQGGAGASQATTGTETEGPGGGGGGGLVFYANNAGTSFTRNVLGGANGITNSPSLAEFPPNGGTRGGNGLEVTFLPNAQCAIANVGTTITATASPVFAGQSGGFAVTFNNSSTVYNANDVVATVQLPAGLSNVTASGALSYSYNSTTGLLTYTGLTSLATSQSYSSTIAFTTPPAGPIAATSNVSTSTNQTDFTNDQATASFNVTPVADVTTSISGQTLILRNAVSTSYTVTYTNNGPSTAASVTRTIVLPTGAIVRDNNGVRVTSGAAADAPGATVVSSTGTANNAVTTLSYPTGDLLAGQSVSYTYQFYYNDGPDANSMTSTVGTPTAQSASGGAGAAPDTYTLNLTETTASADLSVSITAANPTVVAGTTGQFNVTFTNNSGSAAANTVRQVQLPAGLSVTLPANWNYNNSTGLVTYTGGTFSQGANSSSTLAISFTAPATGPVSATATISSDAFDPNTSNNSSSASIDITPSANVSTTLTGPSTAAALSTVNYTATVTNAGPSNASNVASTVQLVPGLFNVTGGTYDFDSGVLTLASISSMAVGETQTFPISFVLPNNNQPVSGRASSTAGTVDPVAANNDGTAGAANVATTVTLPTGSCGGTTPGGTAATQGLYAEYYKTYHNENVGTFFNGKTPNLTRTDGVINFTASDRWGNIGPAANQGGATNAEGYTARMQGSILITTAGTYTFGLNADDGAYLWVGNSARGPLTRANATVDNGGGHGAQNVTATLTLPAGNVPILIIYGEIGGANVLTMTYSGPDTNGSTVVVPQTVLCSRTVTSVLPVELIGFDAKAAGLDAKLSWTTAQEKNNDHFDVERSLDGVHFDKVGERAGHGTTATSQQYAFTDVAAALRGRTVYYRLKQVDTDGTHAYSGVRVVSFGETTDAVLYPNPATEQLFVRLPLSADPLTAVTVYSTVGQEVIRQTIDHQAEATLNVRKLPAGTYLLRLHTASGQTLVRRFVKQ